MVDNTSENKEIVKGGAIADIFIFAPREIEESEMQKIRDQFYFQINSGSVKSIDIFNVMYGYFEESNFGLAEVKKVANTFWPLFVEISWRVLKMLNSDIQAKIIAYTLPFAVSQYINIKPAINGVFVGLYYYDDPNSLYNKVGELLKTSSLPIAFNEKGEKIIMGDFVKKISAGNEGNVSKFQLMADFEKALFAEGEKSENQKIDESKRFQELVEFIQFFIKGTDISKQVVNYLDSLDERITVDLDKEMKNIIGFNLLDAYFKGGEEENTEEPVDFVSDFLQNKPNFTAWIQEPATLRSLLTWLNSFDDKNKARKELEQLLRKELGENALTDMDSALALVSLDEFLNKNNYSGDDLVHYDEKEGKFEWSV